MSHPGEIDKSSDSMTNKIFEYFEITDKGLVGQRRREAANPTSVNLVGLPRYFFRAFNGGTNFDLWNSFLTYLLDGSEHYNPSDLLDERFSSQAKRISLGFFREMTDFIRNFHPLYNKLLNKFGTDYGGWFIDPRLINSDSVVYCIGCGTDISFDLKLIDLFNCKVHAYDPTPQSVEYVNRIAGNKPLYSFIPVGIGAQNGNLSFYSERNDLKGSLSSTNLWGTDAAMTLPVRDIVEIFNENGHVEIDLLKIDIEGAEYDVITRILESGILVKQLCVEFDQPIPPWRTQVFMSKMRRYGLEIYCADRTNATFISNGYFSEI